MTVFADESDIPKAPPASMRQPYLRLSWSYLRWCAGMLLWSLLCVGYFVNTNQTLERNIGLFLGALVIAMVVLPTVLFGGETWYKRLGWITILVTLFAVLFVYPVIQIGLGVYKRIGEGRYSRMPHLNDWWHICLSAMTLIIAAWTALIAARAIKMVRQLARGDYR